MPVTTETGRRGKEKPGPPPTILPAEPAWTITLPAPPSAGGAMDDDRVYVPLQGGQIVAVDRRSGEIVWQHEGKAEWPLLVADGVIFAAAGHELRAVDAASGEMNWQATLPTDVMGVRLADDLLVVLAAPDGVLAYRTSDGMLAWQHSIGGKAGPMLMTVGESGVYVTAAGGRLVALALADGHALWEATIPGTLSEPTAARDRVFVGSTGNFFYAFNSRSGHFEWKWRSGGDVIGAATDANAVYFASLDNIVRAVNRGNGNQRWQKDTGTRPVAPPIVAGPAVVVPGVGATLSAFSVMNGSPLGSFTPMGAAEFKGDPMLDPNLRPFEVAAVILTRDGRLIALHPTGMMFRETPAAPFTQLPGRRLDREPPPFPSSEESSSTVAR